MTATPFVLTCLECDADNDLDSLEAAAEAGWVRLYHDPTGVSWTAVGRCPECRQCELFSMEGER